MSYYISNFLNEFDTNIVPSAEQAFAEAINNFRSAMMGCGPFADLVMAHISDPRQQTPTELPDFGCEPWRYTDHTGKPDGYGVRLAFSASGQDAGMSSRVSTYGYIRVARITDIKELFAGALIDDITVWQPDIADPTEVEIRARAIVSSYLTAFNDFVRTGIPGDELTVDSMTGAFGLASDINNREWHC